MASLKKILQTEFAKKPIPTGVGRLTNQGVMSRRDRFLRIFGGLKTESGATNTKFEQVTEEDLQNLPVVDLVVKMVKSDTLLDMTVDLYTTLVSLEHTLTSEQDRTQRGIDEINAMLEDKKIPLSLLVSHIVSSMILRGNVCVERVFDEKGRPSSVFAIDTRWFEWRLHDVPIDGQMWFLGQFTGEQNTWQQLAETPHVMWLSVNPLVGERTGRSPLASAFDPLIKDTRMLDDLSDVISTQAFIRRYIQFKVIDMKNAGYSDTKIAELVKEAQADMEAWSNLSPDEIPTSTDAIDWNSEPGASGAHGLGFVDTVDRVYDRKGIRGAKIPPFVAGSNEFTAESSSNSQAKFYSVQLGSGQENLALMVEWVYRGFLRAMGLRGDPVFSTKRVNVVERLEEARAFEAIMKALLVATKAGFTLPTAVEMYEAESGMTFPAELKAKITTEWERRMDEASTLGRQPMLNASFDALNSKERRVLRAIKPSTDRVSDGTCDCCDPDISFGVDDAGKFTPTDADNPLASFSAVAFTYDDAKAALELFNTSVSSEYRNLIVASVEKAGVFSAVDFPDTDWQYADDAYFIEDATGDLETQRNLKGNDMYELRNAVSDSLVAMGQELAGELTEDKITLSEFMLGMQSILTRGVLAQFALGFGGLLALDVPDDSDVLESQFVSVSESELEGLRRAVEGQLRFLGTFAENIRVGKFSVGQIKNRAGMYGDAPKAQTDMARAKKLGLSLPVYPGDGNSECLTRCRCHWRIVLDKGEYKAYWELGSVRTRHCDTCRSRSGLWRPYNPAKFGRGA